MMTTAQFERSLHNLRKTDLIHLLMMADQSQLEDRLARSLHTQRKHDIRCWDCETIAKTLKVEEAPHS